ncbi:GDP-mannose 4,6-dehydratase [Serratia sp. M24T3]|uniref:GDP-mannose 4,6-dehydratase n=1 Tax=Serratia sp. M24T3 TaxID=932213 RepID=UPI00025BC8FD|nr:GDP-mannose 4,6-dehydratase [Serratia sp. M24T3]EIC85145.1 Gmd [Serratia sp. M24T3]
MTTNGKIALITGIKGFTGHFMAAELSAAGYQVFGLGTQPSQSLVNYETVDLTNSEATKSTIEKIKPDVVVHLAAIAFVGHADINAFYNVNVCGTRNLLQALVECSHHPEAVLIASSANVYGNAAEGRLREDTELNPANDYAVSKIAMEYVAKMYSDKLPIIITRPFNYTGEGQATNFLIPKIVDHFKRRSPTIELGNIDVWRDFSDVRYVTAVYHALIKSQAFGGTFNVASGEMYSLRAIISLCEEITGHKIEVQVNPLFVRKNEIKELCGDTHHLQSTCKVLPEKIELKDTLLWMLNN